jgi:hypothetical protein
MPDTEQLEARLDADEARLVRDERRLLADEVRIEAEEADVRKSRTLALFGVALATVLALALAALVVAVVAVREDVGSLSRSAPAGSVGTAAIRDGDVTAEKLATDAVRGEAVAAAAIGRDELASGAVAGAQVAPDSLTGADIRERTLTSVPLASDATRLGGLTPDVYLSHVFTVSATSLTDDRPVKGPISVQCPRGSRAISGGAAIRGAARGAALVRNGPEGSSVWTATARVARADTPAWRLEVTAICAVGGR